MTQTTSFSFKKRYIDEKTSAQFRVAIDMSPTVSAQSVDGLLDHFNLKTLNVMEAVAPITNQKQLEQTENTMEKHHYAQKPETGMQES